MIHTDSYMIHHEFTITLIQPIYVDSSSISLTLIIPESTWLTLIQIYADSWWLTLNQLNLDLPQGTWLCLIVHDSSWFILNWLIHHNWVCFSMIHLIYPNSCQISETIILPEATWNHLIQCDSSRISYLLFYLISSDWHWLTLIHLQFTQPLIIPESTSLTLINTDWHWFSLVHVDSWWFIFNQLDSDYTRLSMIQSDSAWHWIYLLLWLWLMLHNCESL